MSELFESPVQVKLRSTGSDRPCLLHADASLVADLSTPERRSLTNHWSPSMFVRAGLMLPMPRSVCSSGLVFSCRCVHVRCPAGAPARREVLPVERLLRHTLELS